MVEVTSLDAAHQAAEAWLRAQGEARGRDARFRRSRRPHWKSRIFTVEPEPGFAFTFWAWTDPVKGKPVAVEGDLSAEGMKFAIVVARWNAVITDRLLEGASGCAVCAAARNASDIEMVRVPGAWEIPAAARTLADIARAARARSTRLSRSAACLRGETAHYEAIYNEVARGIGQSQQETGIPHSFGVLTCETLEQALNRAGIKAGNKGFEAAVAAIEMVSLRRKLAERRRKLDRRHATQIARTRHADALSGGCRQADSGPGARHVLEVGRRRSSRRCAALPKICSASAIAHQEQIDELIVANSRHWRLERMPAVDRNLLRMAVGEMLGFKSTPFPIVINEALEIARRYSAPESINFLNGMLDSIARSLLPK